MLKFVSSAAAAAALICCTQAHAQDVRYYAGMTTGPSKSTLENSEGERFVALKGTMALGASVSIETVPG